MNSSRAFAFVLLLLGTFSFQNSSHARTTLPLSTAFKGEKKFDEVVRKALRENWRKLPIGDRVIKFAKEFHGVPYKSFTLEIHDKVESPSANLDGQDCWTFFEISLGLARMIDSDKKQFTPQDLLNEIEFTRYRGGICRGNYLDRIHYLAEWFFENEARNTAVDITRELGGASLITGRKCQEMTILWKSYRYLRNSPELRSEMAKHEARVSRLPVYYIPKSRVAGIESKLKNGDVLGIVTRHQGGFCSHVGLAYRDSKGVMRIMHASSNYKKVVIDKSVSGYLNSFSSHAGIIVARPQEKSKTVSDFGAYEKNLARLTRS